MSRCVRGATLWQPHPDEVALVDARPRAITLRLAPGFEVELWPGDTDHTDQVAWLDTVAEHLGAARQFMVEHEARQNPGVGQ
ncbi:hypothetical protein [Halostreptopolyspora alba]|uniref:Uncharacterized protein n=1 Tax=Halostreptopolyspora alba TaxID=2487137 RepID=A0A3N0EDE6_9ACTN|nr:hypothetical protein EFW17_07920 [Nocardiopsaceae bacterium YIM 96095]